MSNLPGNPHAQKFADTEAAAEGKRYSPEIARVIQAAQQMEATMALAYEQRTATLVHALLSDSLVTDGKFDEIQAEVRKRLGLGGNK